MNPEKVWGDAAQEVQWYKPYHRDSEGAENLTFGHCNGGGDSNSVRGLCMQTARNG